MTEHDLKVAPEHFASLWDGTKTAELRKDDRGFAVGDTLLLCEYDNDKAIQLFADADIELDIDEAWAVARPQAYTGRTLCRRITHILRGGPWLNAGYVMLSLGGDLA
jgi:hypothetical protein